MIKFKYMSENINTIIKNYNRLYKKTLTQSLFDNINNLSQIILNHWKNDTNIFIAGNGGSGANANHIANDFLYGAGNTNKRGIKIESLSSNSAILTCLANDIGYEYIFSEQINVKAKNGDLLILLSGSGNSKNIVNAIHQAKSQNVDTFGLIGFDGGESKKLLENYIHFDVNDMQVAEDLQMFVFHICAKWLSTIKLN